MLKHSILLLTIIILIISACQKDEDTFQTGDIVFQKLDTPQCKAVAIATGSQYTHCGMVNIIDGELFVFEGLQPCCITPMDEWIKRGIDEHYVVKRMKGFSEKVSSAEADKVSEFRDKYLGKNYDIYFGWSDSLIYCSELVWKVYKDAWDIELCPLRTLKEFDLSHPIVQIIVKQRYGDSIPLEEPVVAPSDLFESELLVEMEL